MTALAARTRPASPAFEHPETVGPLGRLGRWTADHVRAVALAWAVVALALGAFAPKVESALSGAGWQANGSESVQARTLIQRNFAGLSSSALMVVVHSQQSAAGGAAVSVSLTGASGMWSDFNTANRTAMMRSELFSWPVTMAILVLAFGSLVAAGLPLLLTILGLVASAGLLALLTHGFEISIWAMNFALMFALALGIDYALFVVHRFRGAFFGSKLDARDAVAVTMDTAGKAVLFSGSTVLISLSAGR